MKRLTLILLSALLLTSSCGENRKDDSQVNLRPRLSKEEVSALRQSQAALTADEEDVGIQEAQSTAEEVSEVPVEETSTPVQEVAVTPAPVEEEAIPYSYPVPTYQEIENWMKNYQGKITQVEASPGNMELSMPDLGINEIHPQGMIKINDFFIVSSVDKRGKTDNSKEHGYLYKLKINSQGKLELVDSLEDLSFNLLNHPMSDFHPGGMDLNRSTGELVVPVAQYAQSSSTTFLIVNPLDLEDYDVAVMADDHLGTVVCGVQGGEECVIAYNWDSKKSTEYKYHELLQSGLMKIIGRQETLVNQGAYQDCKYVGTSNDEDAVYALCTSTKPYQIVLIKYTVDSETVVVSAIDAPKIGGFIFGGTYISQNPMTFEKVINEDGTYKIRFYFIPHDNQEARLFVYETPDMSLASTIGTTTGEKKETAQGSPWQRALKQSPDLFSPKYKL